MVYSILLETYTSRALWDAAALVHYFYTLLVLLILLMVLVPLLIHLVTWSEKILFLTFPWCKPSIYMWVYHFCLWRHTVLACICGVNFRCWEGHASQRVMRGIWHMPVSRTVVDFCPGILGRQCVVFFCCCLMHGSIVDNKDSKYFFICFYMTACF